MAARQQGIYLAIEGDPRAYVLPDKTPYDPAFYDGALPGALVAPLARLRTDLDRFTPEEADLLSYHAYWSTHARFAALHDRLALAIPSGREYASLSGAEVTELQRLLARGAHRIRRPR